MRTEPLPQTILSGPSNPPQESSGKGRDRDCSNPIAMTKLREGLVAMVVGAKDPVAAFGRIAYPGRSPLLPLSNWNRWLAHGRLHRYEIPAMNHNGNAGPFSTAFRGKVVEAICRELTLTQRT